MHAARCHRDLEPENVFFIADGAARMSDFGLANVVVGVLTTFAQTGQGASDAARGTVTTER